MTGLTSYHAGLAAEEIVGRHYVDQGWTVRDTRWRGAGGEIDVICEKNGIVVFVEVKKSRSHDGAMARLSQTQLFRIHKTAEEFLALEYGGLETDARIDVALVDVIGHVAVLENVTLD